MRELPVSFGSGPRLSGSLCLPEDASAARPVAAILLLGGTGGDTRDGDMNPALFTEGSHPPTRGTLRRIAHHLADQGIASLRFDKRGVGQSEGDQNSSNYDTDLEDNTAAFRTLQREPSIRPDGVGVAGHSAGAFNACLLCRDIPEVAACGLLGALYEPIDDLIQRNWRRIAEHWQQFSENQRSWLREHRTREVVASFRTAEFLAAMQAGVDEVTLSAEGHSLVFNTVRARQDHLRPVAAEFRHVRCPALVLHGGADLNVRVDDCLDTYRALRAAGNEDVELIVIPRVEHSFVEVPGDATERVWERVSMESWGRPMAPMALAAVSSWAVRVLGGR